MVARNQGCMNTCLWGPQQTRFGHLPLTKPKERDERCGEKERLDFCEPDTRKTGRQGTCVSNTVSQVLKIPLGLGEEKVGLE